MGLTGNLHLSPLSTSTVARRAREVGIRLSLGADPGAVVWMLTGGGLRLVAMGGALGLALSVVLAQLIARLLFGISTLDPATFVAVPTGLGLVALLAAWIPARRASHVDPAAVLRKE